MVSFFRRMTAINRKLLKLLEQIQEP